jgi:lipopolysaccharide exporter
MLSESDHQIHGNPGMATYPREGDVPAILGVLYYVIQRLKRGAFLKNVFIVMTGTAAAQLITFLLTPVISWLFTPEDFGALGSFQSVLGVLSSAVTLQYAQAIMLPKVKEDATSVFFVSCLAVVFVSTLSFLICLIFPAQIMSLLNASNAWVPVLLSISVLVNGLNQSVQAWCVRRKEFKRTSTSQVIRSLSASGIWTAGGLANAGYIVLILGTVFGDLAASFSLLRGVFRDIKELVPNITWERLRCLSYEYRDFPIYSAPQNLMNAVSQGLPVLLLGYYYGIGIAGAYAFSVRFLQTPMNLVLTALQQVFFQTASETHNNDEDLFPIFVHTTCALAALAAIPSTIIFIWAPDIFGQVFGHAWREAGVYARWLMLWLFVLFCNVPANICARILRQQRKLFVFECSVVSSRLVILIAGGLFCSALQTIFLFSFVGVVLNATLILWIAILLKARSGHRWP